MNLDRLNATPSVAAYFVNESDCVRFTQLYQNTAIEIQARWGKWDKSIEQLLRVQQLDVLVVELSDHRKSKEVVKALSRRLQPSTKLILMGEQIDVDTYRQLISLGASDYLSGQVDHDQLGQVIGKLTHQVANRTQHARGVLVWGVKGGVGTTTISSALAHTFSKKHHRYTLATDLDLYNGDFALSLNTEGHGQLSSVLTYANDLDDLLVKRSLLEVNENLLLLNDSLELGQSMEVAADQLSNLAEYANEHFSIHLWDRGVSAHHDISGLLDSIKVCVLITDLTMNSARSLAKALKYLESFPHVRPIIVVNATRKKTHHWFTVNELEQSLGIKVDYCLPFAERLLIKSHEQGEIAVEARSSWSKEVIALAQDCLGLSQSKGKLSTWFRRG